MTSKPTEKIIEALIQLLEGYSELQEALSQEYDKGKVKDEDADDDDGEGEISPEVDAAIVTEIKAALESVIEGEDYSPEEVAQVITTLTESLEEIDPTVFEHEEQSGLEEDEDEDYDDIDEDDDDYDLDDEDEDDVEDEDDDE